MAKLGIGRSQVYGLIDRKVRETHLPRRLAAIALASERGLGISRFAADEDLAAIRQSGSAQRGAAPASPDAGVAGRRARAPARRAVARQIVPRDQVFVVHGRDTRLRDELYTFLRALGLNPIEWSQAIR